ncbi:hypothetical protein AVEN_118166-1, partial [Araneus ventricosus]
MYKLLNEGWFWILGAVIGEDLHKFSGSRVLRTIAIDNSVSDSNQIYNLEENRKIRNAVKERKDKSAAFRVTLLLGVCYAANIGGTGSLIGTPSNLAFIAMLEKLYPGSDEISFATWMMYNVPGLFLCVIIGWFYLWLVNIYFSKRNNTDESKDELYGIILKRYQRLGSLT